MSDDASISAVQAQVYLDLQEIAYANGQRQVYLNMLRTALAGLGNDAPDAAKLLAERAEAIQTLRTACGIYGDNDWPDELHLADVISKHLVRHLED